MTIRFDESLIVMARVIERVLGIDALTSGRVLRDVTGRLAFFTASAVEQDVFDQTVTELKGALGGYARSDRVLACKGDFGVDSVLEDASVLHIPVENTIVKLVDRRLVGADWLRSPRDQSVPPPRLVFASIKGGVGRSTALAVSAAHLARQGKRVLIVDLDMEAPGLGAMLLDANTTPTFGVIDALVENSITGLDPRFIADLVGPSALADRAGRIDVMPAFGKKSLGNPGDVLSKIARAYTEDQTPDGGSASILDQIQSLIESILAVNRYDAVLVDARAGLHETTPAAVLGLGAAQVFLFGLNEPQTFQGYEALFAHLFRLIEPKEESSGFLERITMVHAKASRTKSELAEFAARCKSLLGRKMLFPTNGARRNITTLPPAEPFSNVPWDDDAITDDDLGLREEAKLNEPVTIYHDKQFMYFDPEKRRQLLDVDTYHDAYGEFLCEIDALVNLGTGDNANAN